MEENPLLSRHIVESRSLILSRINFIFEACKMNLTDIIKDPKRTKDHKLMTIYNLAKTIKDQRTMLNEDLLNLENDLLKNLEVLIEEIEQ